jgi:hypothetical protein
MWNDYIVEEVRNNRENILKDADFDIKKVIDEIKKIEASHQERLISQPFIRKNPIAV